MSMQWLDLAFMHWPVPPAAVRPHIPAALELHTYDGMAWLGVVPFRMAGVKPRLAPDTPWLSAFAELNVRTYVSLGGKPGVWFFSLDAANPVAVRIARSLFHLPYFDAQMSVQPSGDALLYRSRRVHRGAPPAEFRAAYQPCGPVYRSRPGAFDHWLTERYCLYAADTQGQVWRSDVHHAPWPLQPAQAHIEVNTLAQPIGVDLPGDPPLLHFARRLDVVAWAPERVVSGAVYDAPADDRPPDV